MTRIKMLMAVAPLCSFYHLQEGFVQPSLGDTPPVDPSALPETHVVPAVDNTGKTDELSVALHAQEHPVIETIVEPEKPAAPYVLEYVLDGQPIRECHASVPHALSSVRRLKQLGIIPATSTAS